MQAYGLVQAYVEENIPIELKQVYNILHSV